MEAARACCRAWRARSTHLHYRRLSHAQVEHAHRTLGMAGARRLEERRLEERGVQQVVAVRAQQEEGQHRVEVEGEHRPQQRERAGALALGRPLQLGLDLDARLVEGEHRAHVEQLRGGPVRVPHPSQGAALEASRHAVPLRHLADALEHNRPLDLLGRAHRLAARAVARPELELVVRVEALQQRPGLLVDRRKQARKLGCGQERGGWGVCQRAPGVRSALQWASRKAGSPCSRRSRRRQRASETPASMFR